MTTDGGGRRPLLVARGGASGVAPEHTIPAYEAAIAGGADLVLLDVRLSADDQPVVIRDDDLACTTDGRGAVREQSVQALKRLDAGRWFGRRFRGQRVQTLHEVLERFRGRVGFAVHLPRGSDFLPAIEERVLTLLQIYEVTGSSLVLSADHHALRRCRALDPDLRLVARVGARLLAMDGLAPGVALAGLCLQASLTLQADVAACRAADLDCYVCGVNEPAEARRFRDWGVAGLVTDRVELLRPALATP